MSFPRRETSNFFVIGVAAVLALAVLAASILLLWEARRSAVHTAERQAVRLVSGAEVAINRTLLGVDVMLADMGSLLRAAATGEGQVDSARAGGLVRLAANQNLLVRQVSVFDAKGQRLASSMQNGADGADGAHLPEGFIDGILKQSIPTLTISSPVLSFASAERVVYFGRRIADSASLPRVAVAEVQVGLLSKVLAQGVDSEALAITLERDSGELLVSAPPDDGRLGHHTEPPLTTPGAGSENDIREAPSRLDGAPAIVAVRPTLYGSLLIAASVPLQAALADWRAERTRVLAVAAAFALLILGAAAMTIRHMERLRRARADADAAKTALDQALDSISSGFVLLDADARIVKWNRRYLELLPWLAESTAIGVPIERNIERTVKMLVPEASPAELASLVRYRTEWFLRAESETEQNFPDDRVILINKRPTPDGGAVCLYTDVSEKKRAEIELRIAATAFEVRDAIMVLDLRRTILRVNQAFSALTGFAPDACLGKTPFILHSARHDAGFYEAMWQGVEQSGVWQGEVWQRGQNGSEIPTWLMLTAVKNEADSATHYVCTFSDITERKRYEAELLAARDAALAATRAKSAFLATMSHEIRTPLNGVLGMAQLLVHEQVSDADRRDYARTILNSGNTLLTVLNDVLDLSKVESGKLQLAPMVFSPQQLLAEIHDLFAPAAAKSGLMFIHRWVGPLDTRYRADAGRLRQMLGNLVANAIKFTAQGSISVEAAELGAGDTANSAPLRLRFLVIDTGIGIDADVAAQLFRPFVQADMSITRHYGGTGLGLSIVRSLAELMGGSAGVESERGVGSQFWFEIPVALVSAEDDSRRVPRAKLPIAQTTETAPAPTRTVLVVEDNATNRKVVMTLLKKAGYELLVAENGQQAVDQISGGATPDAILMDCQMPVLDGFNATVQIRQWESAHAARACPIIALTAGAFDEDRRRCMEAGMDDFLAKPVNAKALMQTLDKWLGMSPA